MRTAEILPPELWIIIFDLVLESGVGLLDLCDPFLVPEVLNRIRNPWRYPPTGIPAIQNLRLVCRNFNALLEPSPYFAMKHIDTPITRARAVYIKPCEEVQMLFHRLIAEPSKSYRIVILDLPGPEYYDSFVPEMFDVLCEHSHSLPSVRNLTLPLGQKVSTVPGVGSFWKRLNNAFPDLVCLVVRCALLSEYPTDSPITFKNLLILDHDNIHPDPLVHFPVLRHAACHSTVWYNLYPELISGRRSLETLLIRDACYHGRGFAWNLVPQLKVFGFPGSAVNRLPGLPVGHPLQHLYLYLDIPRKSEYFHEDARKMVELGWLEDILRRFPTIMQITLAYQPSRDSIPVDIWGDFSEQELIRLGLTREYTSSGGHNADWRTILRLSRVDAEPQTKGFGARWDSLRRFTSSRLRI
jgi:hypothetical protein